MRKIDNIDKRILLALHTNARAPVSRIARRCRASREVVTYRLSRLFQDGILKSCIARINMSYLCDGVATVFFKINRNDEGRFDQIIQFLKQHTAVNWMAELCGSQDLVVTMLYKNPEHLGKVISEFTQFMGKALKEHHLALYISEYKLSRQGLFSGKGEEIPPPIIHFRGVKTDPEIDEKDRRIIEILAQNCRTKNTDIARSIGINEDAIRIRIARLEKEGVILGYTIVPNVPACGFEMYYLGMQVEQLTEQNIVRIKEYAHHNPFIGYCSRAAGRYNLIMALYAKDRSHFTSLMLDIRKNLGQLLLNYEFQLNIQEFKETFIPQGFLTKE